MYYGHPIYIHVVIIWERCSRTQYNWTRCKWTRCKWTRNIAHGAVGHSTIGHGANGHGANGHKTNKFCTHYKCTLLSQTRKAPSTISRKTLSCVVRMRTIVNFTCRRRKKVVGSRASSLERWPSLIFYDNDAVYRQDDGRNNLR